MIVNWTKLISLNYNITIIYHKQLIMFLKIDLHDMRKLTKYKHGFSYKITYSHPTPFFEVNTISTECRRIQMVIVTLINLFLQGHERQLI